MRRFPIFFIVAFFAAVGCVAVAAYPLRNQSPVLVDARSDGAGLKLAGPSLSHIVGAKRFPVMGAPGSRKDQLGTRIIADSALVPGTKYSKGARLYFSPAMSSSLGIKAWSVVLDYTLAGQPPSKEAALGWVGAGSVNWVKFPVSAGTNRVQINLTSGEAPPRALAFWGDTSGQGGGIEIQSISFVKPAETPSVAPADILTEDALAVTPQVTNVATPEQVEPASIQSAPSQGENSVSSKPVWQEPKK